MTDKDTRFKKAGQASAKKQDMAAIGAIGGRAKVKKGIALLSPERRREISRMGGIARHAKERNKSK